MSIQAPSDCFETMAMHIKPEWSSWRQSQRDALKPWNPLETFFLLAVIWTDDEPRSGPWWCFVCWSSQSTFLAPSCLKLVQSGFIEPYNLLIAERMMTSLWIMVTSTKLHLPAKKINPKTPKLWPCETASVQRARSFWKSRGWHSYERRHRRLRWLILQHPASDGWDESACIETLKPNFLIGACKIGRVKCKLTQT